MRILAMALVLSVSAFCVAAKTAEPIIPDDTTVHLLLLRQKSVQAELKLPPEVCKKIVEFTNAESAAYEKALKLGEAERTKAIEALEKEEKMFLEANLSPAQRKRLDQIVLQVTGLRQLTKPEVAKALDLTPEQQEKFKAMHAEAAKAFEDIVDSKTTEGKTAKLAKLREEINKRIEAVLTDAQKAKAREIVGEPFKGELVFEEP
jgi:hypothetical protein